MAEEQPKIIKNARFCNRIDEASNWFDSIKRLEKGELGIVKNAVQVNEEHRTIIAIGNGKTSVADILNYPYDHKDSFIPTGFWIASNELPGSVLVGESKKSGLKLDTSTGELKNAISSKYNNAHQCFEVDKLYIKNLVFDNKTESPLFSADFLTLRDVGNTEHVTDTKSVIGTLGEGYFDEVTYFAPPLDPTIETNVIELDGAYFMQWRVNEGNWNTCCNIVDLTSKIGDIDVAIEPTNVTFFKGEDSDNTLYWNARYTYESSGELGDSYSGLLIKNTHINESNILSDSSIFVDGEDNWHVTKNNSIYDILPFNLRSGSDTGYIRMNDIGIATVQSFESLTITNGEKVSAYDPSSALLLDITPPKISVNGQDAIAPVDGIYSVEIEGGLTNESVKKIDNAVNSSERAVAKVNEMEEKLNGVNASITDLNDTKLEPTDFKITTTGNLEGSITTNTRSVTVNVTHKTVDINKSSNQTTIIKVGNNSEYNFITGLNIDDQGHLIGYTVSTYKFSN